MMKRPLSAVAWLLTGLCAVLSAAHAAPPLLDKSLRGSILPDHLSLEVTSLACDATQADIPDGSRIVSERWVLSEGDDHLGYFAGLVRLVSPDGRTLACGLLRGTVGLPGLSPALSACTAPGHLMGWLEAFPAMPATGADPTAALADAAMRPPALLLHFEATRAAQTPGALYEGRLKGLFAPPPAPPEAVAVKPSRLDYGPRDPIMTTIENHADQPVETEDLRTDCTVLWLERYAEGAWKRIANCSIERLTQIIVIKPGASLPVTLPGLSADRPGREPGAYRLALDFRYRDAAGQAVGDPLTTVSPVFRIGSVLPPPAVVVKPERLEFLATEPIRGIVSNLSDRAIVAKPVASFCTILSLQRLVNGSWAQVGDCAYVRDPDPVIVPAGSSLVVPLPPGQVTAMFAPGVYRLVLAYRLAVATSEPSVGDLRAVSPEFRVVGELPLGQVRIDPGKAAYGSDETIMASVTNGLSAPIQAHAWHSYCTLLQLFRRSDSGWAMVGACALTGGPTITIKPGETYPVALPPASASAPAREPGTYKLILEYQVMEATGQLSTMRRAESPLFQVGAPPPPTGRVIVTPDRTSYGRDGRITGVVTNGTGKPIRAFLDQSFCTMLALERLNGQAWDQEAPCPLMNPAARPFDIAPGTSVRAPLPPDATRTPAWTAGTYRLRLPYMTMDETGEYGPSVQQAVSAPFRVGMSLNVQPSPDEAFPIYRLW